MVARVAKFEKPSDWPKGHKDNADHSITFKCVGGPMHGNIVRLYHPFDNITFPYPHGDETYSLTPPIKEGGKWTLVHQLQTKEGS